MTPEVDRALAELAYELSDIAFWSVDGATPTPEERRATETIALAELDQIAADVLDDTATDRMRRALASYVAGDRPVAECLVEMLAAIYGLRLAASKS
jgi:hypothetical protein